MDPILADLRYAARRLTVAPAFSAVAVLTLALGIGATTAIYSVVDAILLRPLPYADPDSLNQVWSLRQGNVSQYLTLDAVEEWRRHDDLFRAAEPFRIRSIALLGGGEPEWVLATEVGGGLMGMLGVPAQVGRPIQPQDAEPGRNPVGVLSDSLWRTRFASDPGIIGRQIRVDDRIVEIVGVMPRAFRFPRDVTQLWLPLSASPSAVPVHALVRLLPGMGVRQAQQRVDMISAALQQDRPSREGWEMQLRPLQENRVNRSERLALYVLLGAVTLVLLIACANVANLLLVQGAGREREVAVRAAVGASRWRLVQQLLTETLMLASAGGALGIVVAMWAVDLLGTYIPRDFTFLSMNEISLDGRVVTFAVALTLLTAVVSGSIPAFRSSRARLQESLKSGARTAAGSARQEYLRRTFVVAQLSLSLMLLVGAGLLARTFVGLARVDPGFDPRNLLTIDLSLPRWKYGTRAAQVQFFQEVADRLRALPGVSAATVSGGAPPMAGGISFGLRFEIDGAGVVLDDPDLLLPTAEVTSDYFALLGIPLVAGRTFSGEERPGGPPAIIVSQEMANRLWKGASPIGQRLRLRADGTWHTVVGVVGDVYQLEYESPQGMFAAYYPMSQSPGLTAQETLIIRTAGDPAPIVPAIRRAIWSVDPDQPILRLETMDARYGRFLGVPRFQTLLMGAFALIGLAIAAIGLYGVLSYAISQRMREFGIRMALGASRSDVLGMVLLNGAGLVVAGILTGIAGSLLMSRAIESLLVGVPRTDALTYSLVAAGLGTISFAACWLPARRATRVDPVVALRCE